MDCNAYHILITGYVDGELSADETQTLKIHLHTCEACLRYLQRLEKLEALLKRYHLLQEIPDVPAEFAHNLSLKLQDVIAKQRTPLGAKLKKHSQRVVTSLTERWANSLRARPATWITAMSFVLVFCAGMVFVNLIQTVRQSPVSRTDKFAPEPASQPVVVRSVSKDKLAEAPAVSQPVTAPMDAAQRDETVSERQGAAEEKSVGFLPAVPQPEGQKLICTIPAAEQESLQPAKALPESDLRVVKQDRGVAKKEAVRALDEIAASRPQSMPYPESSVFAQESAIRLGVRTEIHEINGNVAVLSMLSPLSVQPEPAPAIRTRAAAPISMKKQAPGPQRFQSVAEAQQSVNFPIIEPPYLPPGLSLSAVTVARTDQAVTVELAYTGGTNSLSLFEEMQLTPDARKPKREVSLNLPIKGIVSAQKPFNLLDWRLTSGVYVTLVGDVADEELLKIAASIKN
jgi:NACalpha-BTF3-like transcription factor